jgi:hypothetical protein
MSMTNDDLKQAVVRAIAANGGKAKIIDVARHIWEHHQNDLRASGDRFYRWQYEMRWAANILRHEGRLQLADESPKGIWVLRK